MLLTFRIQLANIKKPPVWRKLAVPADFSFDKFHRVIQAAFGWKNCHLYLFSSGGFSSSSWITIPEFLEDDDVILLDARKEKLTKVFPGHKKFTYLYDFGDDWNHDIRLEDFSTKISSHAELLGGKGACPPEDSGGLPGYENLKAVLSDPRHPDYDDMRMWYRMEDKDVFDPLRFDVEAAREAVREV